MGKRVDISIFIVNYNTCCLLRECLRSIFDSEGGLQVEVFVADNHSRDGSREMVRGEFPEVFLSCHEENVGYTRAVNGLLPRATGDYYLLLHPDVELLPNTLKEFLNFFERHPEAGILGGNLFYPDGTPNPCEILFPGVGNDLKYCAVRIMRKVPFFGGEIERHNPTEWKHEKTTEVMGVWDACMIFRKDVLRKLGEFDERFFVWFADWDLCRRARETGWSVYYVERAKTVHHERFSVFSGHEAVDEIRYKTDGRFSACQQIRDRYVLLRKYGTPSSVCVVKMIQSIENGLRLGFSAGRVLLGRISAVDGWFEMRTCLRTIQAILKS